MDSGVSHGCPILAAESDRLKRNGSGQSQPLQVIYIETISMLIQENVLLAPLTTLKIGGPARYFAEAKTIAAVGEAVEFARAQNLPLFILGGGSNLVVSDAGW